MNSMKAMIKTFLDTNTVHLYSITMQHLFCLDARQILSLFVEWGRCPDMEGSFPHNFSRINKSNPFVVVSQKNRISDRWLSLYLVHLSWRLCLQDTRFHPFCKHLRMNAKILIRSCYMSRVTYKVIRNGYKQCHVIKRLYTLYKIITSIALHHNTVKQQTCILQRYNIIL